VGLRLEERVVRRHVARLESVGWLRRAAWVWGQGSIVWLTETGLRAVGLGSLPAVKGAPSPTSAAHAVHVGWSAARLERRGRRWLSKREIAVENERWEIQVRADQGYRGWLPDLAVWLPGRAAPGAIVFEAGYRRSDRQRAILEAWRHELLTERYCLLRYDCASVSVARGINGVADRIGMSRRSFMAAAQLTPEEIAAIQPVDQQAEQPAPAEPPPETRAVQPSPASAVEPPLPVSEPSPAFQEPAPYSQPAEPPTRSEADRERLIREILGHEEPKPRRRFWR
jgi:hypothetical protein